MPGLFDTNNRFQAAEGAQGPPPMAGGGAPQPQAPGMGAARGAINSAATAAASRRGRALDPSQYQPGSLEQILAQQGLTTADTSQYRYNPNSGQVDVLTGLDYTRGLDRFKRGWDVYQNPTEYTGPNGSAIWGLEGSPTPEQRATQQDAVNGASQAQQQQDTFLQALASQDLDAALAAMAGQQAQLGLQFGFAGDQAALASQGATNTRNQGRTLLDLALRGVDADANMNRQNRGFADRQLDLSLQGRDLTDQGFGFDEDDLRRNEAAAQRARVNRYAAGGSWFTPENRLAQSDLQDQLRTGLGRVGLGRQNNDLGRQGDRLGHEQAMARLAHEGTGINIARDTNRARAGFLDQDLALALQQAGLQQAMAQSGIASDMGQLSQAQAQAVADFLRANPDAVGQGIGGAVGANVPGGGASSAWMPTSWTQFLRGLSL